MSSSTKKFTITHDFCGLLDYDENYDEFSEQEEHFHMNWVLNLCQEDGNAELIIFGDPPEDDYEDSEPFDKEYSIEAEIEIKLLPKNRKIERKTHKVVFTYHETFHKVRLMSWDVLRKRCSVDEELKVEVHIVITKMVRVAGRKTVDFGEAMREYSDVALIVGEKKFHVSKLYLSFESSYFKSMFLGNFAESNKSEVTLHDIDTYEFQKFIEVLYGRNAIDDDYLASILRLADMFDASIVRERCQDFLVEKSKKSLKEKLELASEYRMENLKKKCLSDIKALDNLN
ncbi:hypothetical protein GCK72_007729 [Caenorhabditis remanei]|uniref:BTB domain-containing protein n=1 Tax=Caenorhabditis remanei TaxID=31234 RepID=A0A6A5HI09_CAERE|nr:hypothetical protein GCK72_007729 [Caenorhabditis remanei]KAF1767770.1 hypothetical protein GCK72_007729 [Caenorhabditis remanei]